VRAARSRTQLWSLSCHGAVAGRVQAFVVRSSALDRCTGLAQQDCNARNPLPRASGRLARIARPCCMSRKEREGGLGGVRPSVVAVVSPRVRGRQVHKAASSRDALATQSFGAGPVKQGLGMARAGLHLRAWGQSDSSIGISTGSLCILSTQPPTAHQKGLAIHRRLYSAQG
jgi:hypothetical protein